MEPSGPVRRQRPRPQPDDPAGSPPELKDIHTDADALKALVDLLRQRHRPVVRRKPETMNANELDAYERRLRGPHPFDEQ